jgi:hypothetical protein
VNPYVSRIADCGEEFRSDLTDGVGTGFEEASAVMSENGEYADGKSA